MKWTDRVYDVESYRNFFCVNVIDVESGERKSYRVNQQQEFAHDNDHEGIRLWGMFSSEYDDPMLAAW